MELTTKQCLLCKSTKTKIKLIKSDHRSYWDCDECGLIFLPKEYHLSSSMEKSHYLAHNNDVSDTRYQSFLLPVVDYVQNNLKKGSLGLDYGAGPGPAAALMLRERQYVMNVFDPYFWNDPDLLKESYDFIISTEVIEHFSAPDMEFDKLKSMLKKQAPLVMMTELYEDMVDFSKWYYHLDHTHVVFYRYRTFEWIKGQYHFSSVTREGSRLIILNY